MRDFVVDNVFTILSFVSLAIFNVIVLKLSIDNLNKKFNNKEMCNKHSKAITLLKEDNIQNKVFQAKILQTLENINQKIDFLIAPIQKSIDDIKKKLNVL